MPRTYDPEFRQRVVELVWAGRPVQVVAAELGLAEATIYRWKAKAFKRKPTRPPLTWSSAGSTGRHLTSWVTDITEHSTREGKVCCCVVLDVFSRRVVDWSIDSHQPPRWSPTLWAWPSPTAR